MPPCVKLHRMIYSVPPPDFQPQFEVSTCFFRCQGEILLLLRAEGKLQAGKWCLPGGKIDPGETKEIGLCREVKEEIQYQLHTRDLQYHGLEFVRYPEFDFIFHMFSVYLTSLPTIILNSKEHQEYCWVTPEKALQMDLIRDEDPCIKKVFKL